MRTNEQLAHETAERIMALNYPKTPAIDNLSEIVLAALTRVEDRNRARLEAAEEVVRAVEKIISDVPADDGHGGLYVMHFDGEGKELGPESIDPMAVISNTIGIATRALASWTAAQGETLGGDSHGAPTGLYVTPAIPSEPASRAVLITAETVVPFPCWLHRRADMFPETQWEQWAQSPPILSYYDYHHPDQPTPPTSTPL